MQKILVCQAERKNARRQPQNDENISPPQTILLSILLLIRDNSTTVIHHVQFECSLAVVVVVIFYFFLVCYHSLPYIQYIRSCFKQQSQSNPSVCFFFLAITVVLRCASCMNGCLIFGGYIPVQHKPCSGYCVQCFSRIEQKSTVEQLSSNIRLTHKQMLIQRKIIHEMHVDILIKFEHEIAFISAQI